jgi:hypothetical protein
MSQNNQLTKVNKKNTAIKVNSSQKKVYNSFPDLLGSAIDSEKGLTDLIATTKSNGPEFLSGQ